MSSISIQQPAGASSSGSSSTSAATGAVAALNSPRMDDGLSTADTRESSADVEAPPKPQQEKKGWFWSQFITRSGLFAPLAPEDSPEAVAEREKLEQARLRQEKLESVHRWRPSQDNTTSPQKPRASASHPSRPSMMKRLSSAVELKWWSGEAATRTEEDEEEDEDLQKPKRSSRLSQSSMNRNDDIAEASSGDIQLR